MMTIGWLGDLLVACAKSMVLIGAIWLATVVVLLLVEEVMDLCLWARRLWVGARRVEWRWRNRQP